MGRWRTEDNEFPVDATGTFSLSGGESFTFNNGVELARQLSTSRQIQDCYTLHWLRYATGQFLSAHDEGVPELQEHFHNNDSITDLLVELASSDFIRYRRAGGGQ